ncbi:hypothetical protein TWF788_001336 [Orbilia oligospora]|uniref:Uncharacterized protein n=1 Tax=Orbilia oligospora TaxID=2813651 RepID=A0A7C8KDP0_ORBOL|nr:hypothetical protein TWF788_001336 [Orbilia oligospora]
MRIPNTHILGIGSRFFAGRSEVIFRFGNKKALAILPDVEYEFSIWYRQLSYTKSICSISVALGNRGLPGIGGLGTVNSGFGIGPILRPTASLNWTKSSMRFKTQYTELGMFITAACQCPIGESCGDVYLGFDDITITPVVPV